MVFVEIAIVLVLILVNGLLAMSELATISARPARLKAARERGASGAGHALALALDPGRFLSTVQIGITLVGILSGAVSGATLGLRLQAWLISVGVPDGAANALGVGLVVAVITYVSLIVGELVPKRLALRDPERIAIAMAPAMTMLSRIALPLVWLLDVSGRLVLRLLGQTGDSGQAVSDEEIRTLIAEAEQAGTIEADERRMIAGVMRLADRKAHAIMTPRGEVEWLDLTAGPEEQRRALTEATHSLLPVAEGVIDEVIGVVSLRKLLAAGMDDAPLDLRAHVEKAPVVHDIAGALSVLSTLREADLPLALIYDEYGHFEGIVTPADILEAIAGVFRSDAEEGERDIVQRADGSWLLPGSMPADEMADHLGIALPARRSYATLAGFLLAEFRHLPRTGDAVETSGWRFEIVDLDGRRIDRVLASKEGAADPAG